VLNLLIGKSDNDGMYRREAEVGSKMTKYQKVVGKEGGREGEANTRDVVASLMSTIYGARSRLNLSSAPVL